MEIRTTFGIGAALSYIFSCSYLSFWVQLSQMVSAYSITGRIMKCILFPMNFIPGPDVIKLFSCSTQLSMNFLLLINVKMPTIVGILTFISRKNSILGLSEPNISQIS